MACKGCKKKSFKELNTGLPVINKDNSLVTVILIIYTLLAVYGIISLIVDIKNLFI